jgi:hypothetical protein
MLPEPIAVTLQVTQLLKKLNIPYLIGGSFASTVHGLIRTTQDTDLMVVLQPQHVTPLVNALQNQFYLDENAIREAILHRRSFNLIHLETMFKVDMFISKQRPFDQSQLARRTAQIISANPEQTAYFATSEDTILTKLEWYRAGDETSDRQWQDVLGVLKIQNKQLDIAYLRQWAAELGVADLLETALIRAGVA